jgi:glycosyltransferase involved in cell wall biosynthesis
MGESLKVLHLVEAMGGSAHLWGKERVIHWLMQAQRAHGLEAELIAFSPALLGEVLQNEGFATTTLGETHAAFSQATLSALIRTLREKPGAVVHTHGYKANVMGRAAKLAGAPMKALISTSHGFDSYAPRLAFYNALDRWTGYFSTRCTVTDPRMALRFPPGVRVDYVANALPDAAASTFAERAAGRLRFGLHEGQFAVGMLHRLIPQKGVSEYLGAARDCHGWGRTDVVFLIAGEGPLRGEVEAAAQELPNVRYLGYIDPPDEYLAALDAFIQPSRSEGLSLALLQAMRAGRPIIATRVGATQETVKDGFEAMVIEPHDPTALAAAVLRLADDRSYAETLGLRARERFVTNFRIDRQSRDFLKLYQG